MNEEVVVIPKRIFETIHTEKYFEQFWLHVQNGLTHLQAWELLETDLIKYSLPSKYSSYQSFKRAKSYYHNRREQDILLW